MPNQTGAFFKQDFRFCNDLLILLNKREGVSQRGSREEKHPKTDIIYLTKRAGKRIVIHLINRYCFL